MMKDIDLIVLNKWSFLNNSISIRANLIILHLQGKSEEEISKCLLISRRKVTLWIERYKERGLSGLVDEQRNGRSVRYKKLKAIHNFLEKSQLGKYNETIEVFSHRIRRSPDIVWKSARMLGVTPKKQLKRDFKVSINEDLDETGLVGVYFDHMVLMAVYDEDSKNHRTLLNHGKWLNPHFKKYIDPTKVNGLFLCNVIRKFKEIDIKPFTKRARDELWKRWANEIIYAEPIISKSLSIKIYGHFSDGLVFNALRLTHQNRAIKSKSRLTNIEIPILKVSFLKPMDIKHQTLSNRELDFYWLIKTWQQVKLESKCFAWCRTN